METLQPKLRFPEFKNDVKSYKNHFFNDLFIFSTGKNIKQSEASPDFQVPCVRYGELYHMYNEVIRNVINKTNLDISELHFSNGNEILLPSAGEDPLDIGSASALTIENVAIGRTINVLRPLKENIYSQIFVSYYINHKLKVKISTLAKGSSISNVYNSDLKTLEINLPSLPEQTRIANFLSAVDEKLYLLKEKKALLEEYKKGMMQKIFKQELRFKDDSGEDFGDWEEKILGEVGSVLNGLTYSPDDVSADGVLVLRSSNIKHGRLKFEDNIYVNKDNFTPVIENDILICVRNGSRNLIGKNTIITKEIIGVAFGAFMTVYRSEFNNFLIHWFGSEDFFENVNLNLGATINSINGSDLKKFKIPFPSQKEQTKIAQFLSAIDEKIGLVGNQIEETVAYKKGLLQGMFV